MNSTFQLDMSKTLQNEGPSISSLSSVILIQGGIIISCKSGRRASSE